MKKKILLLSICFLCCQCMLKAQDTLVMNDGSQTYVKVLEVGETTISYKKQENIQGPTYTIDLSRVFMAFYKGGKRESFSVKANPTYNQPAAMVNTTGVSPSLPSDVLRNDIYELAFSAYSSDYANKKKQKGTAATGTIKVLKNGNYYMEVSFSTGAPDLFKEGYIFFTPVEEKYQKLLDTKYESSSGTGQWFLPAGFFGVASTGNYYVTHYAHKSLFGQDFSPNAKGRDAHKYDLQDVSTAPARILSVAVLWLQQNFK